MTVLLHLSTIGAPLSPRNSQLPGARTTSRFGPLFVAYTWAAERGAGACAQVLGFTRTGAEQWISAGCGKGGAVDVYWGNLWAVPKIRVKSTSLTSFTGVRWCAGASASKCFFI